MRMRLFILRVGRYGGQAAEEPLRHLNSHAQSRRQAGAPLFAPARRLADVHPPLRPSPPETGKRRLLMAGVFACVCPTIICGGFPACAMPCHLLTLPRLYLDLACLFGAPPSSLTMADWGEGHGVAAATPYRAGGVVRRARAVPKRIKSPKEVSAIVNGSAPIDWANIPASPLPRHASTLALPARPLALHRCPFG